MFIIICLKLRKSNQKPTILDISKSTQQCLSLSKAMHTSLGSWFIGKIVNDFNLFDRVFAKYEVDIHLCFHFP